ncbi:ribulose-phosphate 3-epimerase [Atopobium fossor]|uniref:ribulose-phosphate 3-epimerase n=1 Tax=Atopobium fossor TaxID=39487 RepID=UPI00040A6915|nr:ribulose-phosphate 3-epimerase [Atopobium fossor]
MHKEVLIAPSILSADFMHLGAELDRIATADYIHFDVMDGNFVPNLSFGIPILKQVKAHASLPVDVHLMIKNPDKMIDTYLDAGADLLCFHIEAAKHAHRMISRIHERGALAGVALNPGTSLALLDSLLCDVDMILIMSVNPGYGGQSYIPTTAQKLKKLHALCQEAGVSPLIEVDGGINAQTAQEVCSYGANMLVAGSAVFRGDYAQNISDLRVAGKSGLDLQI